ncbi:MAG: PDZ domain-containing protein [Planctomycetota bacterium]|nr:PDZ domain-containing protein [Planctomycetota bacterium]
MKLPLALTAFLSLAALPDLCQAQAWFGAGLVGVDLDEAQAAAVPSDASAAVRLDTVVPAGPASHAGLQPGDLLVTVDAVALGPRADQAHTGLVGLLAQHAPGDGLVLGYLRREASWTRDGQPVAAADLAQLEAELPAGARTDLQLAVDWSWHLGEVVLGRRPDSTHAKLPPTAELYAHYPATDSPLLVEVTAALASAGGTADQADLRARLGRLADHGDGSRANLVTLVQREPWRLPALGEALGADLLATSRLEGAQLLGGIGRHLARIGDRTGGPGPKVAPGALERPQPGDDLELHVAWMESLLEAGAAQVEASLAAVDGPAREHVRAHWRDLGDRFDEHIYLHLDPDKARFERNLATIAAGELADPAPLFDVPGLFAPLLDPDYMEQLERELDKAGHDLWKAEVFSRSTPLGRIVIAGRGDDVHRHGTQGQDLPAERMVALRIDLGGSDLYADGAGTTVNQAGRPRIPVSINIDLAGDDVYESTHAGSIGAGVLGVGLVLDLEGDDSYVGTRWSQGAGMLGMGLVLDGAGDDRYRIGSQGQGLGAWGVGALVDARGADRYEASIYGQGVGLAGGFGLCLDGWGDDEYYCKGRTPTGYGTAGVFEGWGQGCGIGFRSNASGGLGLLSDGAGRDRFEAGNFAQGGGYYYGFGGLWSHGDADDSYIGSRYDQGFSAHQAVGYFLEAGGDDSYTTRHAVAHGLAWDECVTWFEDRSGADRYRGGSFSLGAAAHNSICVFHERGGVDTYLWDRLGAAGSNEYHGGTSLGWFQDEGGDADVYLDPARDSSTRQGPLHGFFRDL